VSGQAQQHLAAQGVAPARQEVGGALLQRRARVGAELRQGAAVVLPYFCLGDAPGKTF